jgi:hypothetical protein
VGILEMILSESGYPGFSGFTGCCLMIVYGKLGFFRMLFNDYLWDFGILFCLNQDIQD